MGRSGVRQHLPVVLPSGAVVGPGPDAAAVRRGGRCEVDETAALPSRSVAQVVTERERVPIQHATTPLWLGHLVGIAMLEPVARPAEAGRSVAPRLVLCGDAAAAAEVRWSLEVAHRLRWVPRQGRGGEAPSPRPCVGARAATRLALMV